MGQTSSGGSATTIIVALIAGTATVLAAVCSHPPAPNIIPTPLADAAQSSPDAGDPMKGQYTRAKPLESRPLATISFGAEVATVVVNAFVSWDQFSSAAIIGRKPGLVEYVRTHPSTRLVLWLSPIQSGIRPIVNVATEAVLEVKAEKGDAAALRVTEELLASYATMKQGAIVDACVHIGGARQDDVIDAIESERYAPVINDNLQELKLRGVYGTPYFVVGDVAIAGMRPPHFFEVVLENARSYPGGGFAHLGEVPPN